MKAKRKPASSVMFILAGIFILTGLLGTGLLLTKARLLKYPLLISEAYHDGRHKLLIPGETQIFLSRTGAYGIYYEIDATDEDLTSKLINPPVIDCVLKSQSTNRTIKAAPDHIEKNRYTNRNENLIGVLIMSLTVDQPGAYRFACDYQDNQTNPEIQVSLGPNYFWEFIRVIGKIGLPVLGGIIILIGSLMFSLVLVIVGLVIKKQNQ